MKERLEKKITPIGSIPKSWKKTTLQEVSDFITKGATPTTYGFDWVEEGVPFLRSECVSETGFNEKGLAHISDKANDALKRSKVKSNDILISITGNVGRVAVFPEYLKEGNINQHIARVRVIEQEICDRKYIYFQLTRDAYRKYYDGIITGAAYPQLSLKQIRETPIYFPPLPTQRKIAAILSAYDDLIENNLKRIKLLEEKAQLTYEEWFVRMKFPGHETAVIDAETGLPEGWERRTFSSTVSVNPKTTIKKGLIAPFVPMGSISESSMVIEPIEERAVSGGMKFKNGDTLFARITPCLENGKTGFVQFMDDDSSIATGSTEYIVLRETEDCGKHFIYCTSREEEFRENAIKSMVGSDGRQRVKPDCFDKYYINLGPLKIRKMFEDLSNPIFRSIQIFVNQNASLKEARDILLPRLMTGMIDVENLAVPTHEIA